MKNDSLGDRCKAYEGIYKQYLPQNQYYVCRIDGKSFHNYTKGCDRPFDSDLIDAMQKTMVALCKEIQGAVFGYTQSDEITIVFTDTQSITSEIWFGGNIQKIVSIAASTATSSFNTIRNQQAQEWFGKHAKDLTHDQLLTEQKNRFKQARFDARVYSVSTREEVLNHLYWRQQDASKNSVQMLARSLFSHKECQNKNGSELQDMMMLEKGMNWNDIGTVKKRGTACYRKMEIVQADLTKGDVVRFPWFIDEEAPIFSNDWGWFDGKVL
tara:strand:- start:12136 stop:12942 length:807 start_codon:yes stop_codon:yes gene_type:complete